MYHEAIGTILFACLAFVGIVGVITGHGIRSTISFPFRVAMLFFVAIWPFLMMVTYGLLGAFDEVEPTFVSTVWLLFATPLLTAAAYIGMYVAWAQVYAWMVNAYVIIQVRLRSRVLVDPTGNDSEPNAKI